ncbi:MAG: hypothetical protein LC793_14175 [Thermomicrobia bacterium]|nr:hypothetical protein [Thermomicrobia bacterium]MCA1722691.1 hypothetical protein [Thermomicrobia bacterium]
MSSRRDRAKADATRTPLADLAPVLPERRDGAQPTKPEPEPAATIPDDDILPEPSATMPTPLPETETAPTQGRPRPGARKIADRSRLPAIPRTIAEMQTGAYQTNIVEANTIAAQEPIAAEPEPAPLFISRQTLLVTTLVPYAIVALIPTLLDLLCRATGLSSTPRLVVSFIATALCSLVALALLLRNWRVAFHDAPSELHPVSILALWEQRASGTRRDGWVTGSLAVIAGFVVMLSLSVVVTVIARGFTAAYAIPYLLVLLFAKSVGAILFVGYLQRGTLTFQSATKATFTTGVLYGIALAVWNACTILASNVANPLTLILTYALISLAVALAVAWIRLRSGSLLAAVAFQLLLLLLGIAV